MASRQKTRTIRSLQPRNSKRSPRHIKSFLMIQREKLTTEMGRMGRSQVVLLHRHLRGGGARSTRAKPSKEVDLNRDPFADFPNYSERRSSSRRSRFQPNRSSSSNPDMFSSSSFHQSFMVKDPDTLFKEFFGGKDPFEDMHKFHTQQPRINLNKDCENGRLKGEAQSRKHRQVAL